MDFNQFQTELFSQLKTKSKKCLETIENNKDLIQENLGNAHNTQIIDDFVNRINDIIVENNDNLIDIVIDNNNNNNNNKNINHFTNKYDLIEKVLKHPYFINVLNTFRNSNVLLRACKEGNKNAAKWLLSMNVVPYLQDENGVSALMYAAQQNFDFVIKPFLSDSHCLNLEDDNGENLLFYCLRNPKILKDDPLTNNKFQLDLMVHSNININQFNHQGETALTYCIKNDIIEPISKFLLHNPNIDVNIADSAGKTAAMYLTEKGLCTELLELHRKNCNYDYIDMNGESAMSILLKKLYFNEDFTNGDSFYNYTRIMSVFVNYQLDFNYSVDKDENTAFMVILIVNDMTTAKFCARYIKKLDLSVKNKYGESATSLCYKLKRYELLPLFKNNPTYDYNYRDPINQNTLLMISAINNAKAMKDLLENDPSIINEVNSNNENALIIATKVNQIQSVEILLKYGINVNHQDNLGNTALHYAIEIQELFLIHQIMNKKPDIHLKNNEGKSPMDYANEISDNICKEIVLSILSNPSRKIHRSPLDNQVENKYIEEVNKYLTPYANNNYFEFQSTKQKETLQSEVYDRNKGMGGKFFSPIDLLSVVIIIVIVLLPSFLNSMFNTHLYTYLLPLLLLIYVIIIKRKFIKQWINKKINK